MGIGIGLRGAGFGAAGAEAGNSPLVAFAAASAAHLAYSVEVILLRSGSCLGGTGSVVISSGIHILVRILVIDVGERVRRAHSRLLLAQLFCQLIVVGIGGQVLELSGNFLLFCFLTSAAHLTPCDYCAVRFINNREYH